MTHTYVECAISPAAHAEIKSALTAAGYGHAIEGETIDMHGLALVVNTAAAAHPDDIAVDSFAALMKRKMAASRAHGRSGWDDPAQCTVEYLSDLLRESIGRGDPVDVANFAMMLDQRGSEITAAPSDALECDFCRVSVTDPWHGSTPENKHIHACSNCLPHLPGHMPAAINDAPEATAWSDEQRDGPDVATSLKPCPFCGEEVHADVRHKGTQVFCLGCGAAIEESCIGKRDAAKRWNTRTRRQATQKRPAAGQPDTGAQQ